jgi:hypothetical protein
MPDRTRPLLLATILTFLPMILVFPVLALARFGPTGPQSVWPIVLYAPFAMWMQTRAIKLLLQSYRNTRDPILFAILPLGLFTLFGYALHGALLILGLPAFLYRFI